MYLFLLTIESLPVRVQIMYQFSSIFVCVSSDSFLFELHQKPALMLICVASPTAFIFFSYAFAQLSFSSLVKLYCASQCTPRYATASKKTGDVKVKKVL